MRVYSSRLIADLLGIIILKQEGEEESLVLYYSDKSKQHFICKNGSQKSVVSSLELIFQRYYNVKLQVKESTETNIMPKPRELPANERLMGLPVKKYCRRTNQNEDYVLAITKTEICLCSSATIISAHPLAEISTLIAYEDHNKFAIEYTKSTKDSPAQFYSLQSDGIIANLFAIVRAAGVSIPIELGRSDEDTNSFVLRASQKPPISWEIEEHFMHRISRLTGKSTDINESLIEFNKYVPCHVTLQSKDKQNVALIFKMLQYQNYLLGKGEGNPQVVINCIQCLQRLACARISYLEIPKIKDAVRIITDVVDSNNDRVAAAGALLALILIEQPFDQKTARYESQQKNFLLSGELSNKLLSLLVNFSQTAQDHILLISKIFDILVSVLDSHSNTTDSSLFSKLSHKLTHKSMIIALFSYCRSECMAIGLSASLVLKVLFTSASGDALKQMQEYARQNMSLLHHAFQMIDSRLPIQRTTSGSLVGLMADNNSASIALIKRLFPKKLIEFLENGFSPKKQSRVQGISRRMSNISSGSEKLHWKHFAEQLMVDHENMELLWNEDTRNEFSSAVLHEIMTFETDSAINREKKKADSIWNHEEFTVKYKSLERELPVGDYYAKIILRVSATHIENPGRLLSLIFFKILLENDPANLVSYLECMTLVFDRFHERIQQIPFMENLINLLQKYVELGAQYSRVVQTLFLFLLQTFRYDDNTRNFIDFGGCNVSIADLTRIHVEPKTESFSRGVLCMQVLALACKLIKGTDERGFIKIPIPKAKRDLCNSPHFPYIIQALCARDDNVIESAAVLLDYLLLNNTSSIESLQEETGILYFLLSYKGNNAWPQIAQLLKTIHLQQPKLLYNFFPASLIVYLENQNAETFASVFIGDKSTPEVIWSQEMRIEVQLAIDAHILPFMEQLTANPSARYQYQPLAPITWENLEQELRCGNYFVRSFLDNPNWSVDEPEEVLSDAIAKLPNASIDDKILLFKAQTVLFKRYHKVRLYRDYHGFPSLLKSISLDRTNPNLSAKNLELINAALDLIFYSAWASKKNTITFLNLQGLSYLGTILFCSNHQSQSPEEGSTTAALIIIVLKVIVRMLLSQNARDQVTSDVIRDILMQLSPSNSPTVTGLAMQCVLELAEDSRLLELLYKNGVHFYLLNFLLAYEPGVKDDKLEAAGRAFMVLGNIAGIFTQDGQPTNNAEASLQSVLSALITKGLLLEMRRTTELQFLDKLSSTIETPFTIWNESTRSSLRQLINTRIEQCKSGELVVDDTTFVYDQHAQEVSVAGIFVRVFIKQQDFELEAPSRFLQSLLQTIKSEQKSSTPERLRMLMLGVYKILSEKQGLESYIVSPEVLHTIFYILNNREDTLQQLSLSIIAICTTNQQYINTVCEDEKLRDFGTALKKSMENKQIVLDIISNMVSSSSKAVVGMHNSGLVLFLFQILADSSDGARHQAASVLHQLQNAAGRENSFYKTASLFLPEFLIATFTRPAHEIVQFYDMTISNCNIIWDDRNRSASQNFVNQEVSKLQVKGTIRWETSNLQCIDFAALNQQLIVGGIYVRNYNSNPTQRLFSSRTFVEGAVSSLKNVNDDDLVDLLQALLNLLNAQPQWAHHIPASPVAVEDILHLIIHHNNPSVHDHLTKILGIITHTPTGRTKLSVQRDFVNALTKNLKSGSEAIKELSLRTLYLSLKREYMKTMKLMQGSQLISGICAVLNQKLPDTYKLACACVKAMLSDRRFAEPVKAAFNEQGQAMPDVSSADLDKLHPEWLKVPPLVLAREHIYIPPISVMGSELHQTNKQQARLVRAQTSIGLQSRSAKLFDGLDDEPPPPPPRSQEAPISSNSHSNHSTLSSAPPTLNASTSTPSMDLAIQEPPKPAPQMPRISQADNFTRAASMATISTTTTATKASASPIAKAPVVAPSGGGPPPPPPTGMPPPPKVTAMPPPSKGGGGGRNMLLDSIRKGKSLKKVKPKTAEERKKERQSAATTSAGGGGDMMAALAGALAARRKKIVIDVAANPYGEDNNSDSEEEWE